MKKNIIIIGAGTMSPIFLDIIEKQNLYNIVGLIDSKAEIGANIGKYSVIGRQENIGELINRYRIQGACITIGDNYSRFLIKRAVENSIEAKYGNYKNLLEWVNIIHPSCVIGDNVKLGMGILMMANVTVNPKSEIGDFCHLYTGAIVEHNNEFEHYTSISAGSVTGGYVKVAKFSAICLNCTIFDRVSIGGNSIIGSGSLVTKNIGIDCLYYGNPAKFIRNRNLGEKYLK